MSILLKSPVLKLTVLKFVFIISFIFIASCSETTVMPETFVKAEPAVDAVLDRRPRTLRIYLTALPDIPKSTLKLFGETGEVSLSRFHTMGADDLMIEIDDHPLPNGKYRVEWTAVVEGSSGTTSGQYEFTVAVDN